MVLFMKDNQHKPMPKTIIELARKFKKWIIVFFIGGIALAAPAIFPEIIPAQPDGPQFVETLADETVIRVKTWGCENWQQGYLWNTQTQPPRGMMCPDAGGGRVILMTDPSRMGTMTVMGPSDIENEIIQEDWERGKKGETKMDIVEKEGYKTKRLQDIQDAIQKARLLESK